MHVIYINGAKCGSWKPRGQEVSNNNDTRHRSKLHVMARELIKRRFPTMQVLEEVAFQPMPKSTLYFDFFLPLRKLAIEVHGQQHYSFNTMYHSSRFDFLNQLTNDDHKKQWCNLNGIELVILPYDRTEEWDKLI